MRYESAATTTSKSQLLLSTIENSSTIHNKSLTENTLLNIILLFKITNISKF